MILGVDPGLTGALAVLSEDGSLYEVVDMPVVDKNVNATGLYHWLKMTHGVAPITQAVVERVSSMPGQGVSSVFKFGKGYGQVLGVISCLELSVSDPTPTQWKREMGLSSDKELSRAVAIKTWPASEELFKRKKDADRAEAALLALWWLRKFGNLARNPEVVSIQGGEASAPAVPRGRVLKRR